MPMPFIEILFTPLLIGLSHSMETDHVVAVGNLVGIKGSWHAEAFRGATWGMGHTVSVGIAAATMAFVKGQLPHNGAWSFELLVGVMMVLIGCIKLYRYFKKMDEYKENPQSVFFQVGLVHGLAGSGAIAALMSGGMANTTHQLVFLLLFGLGTILGMGFITALLTRIKFLNPKYLSALSVLIAFASLAYGLRIIYEQTVFSNLLKL